MDFLWMAVIDPTAFSIGPISIKWYGITMTLGIVVACLAGLREPAFRELFQRGLGDPVFLFAIPMALIGARLYFVLFSWEWYAEHPGAILALWKGGLAIHGALIASALIAWWFAKRHGVAFLTLLDMALPCFLIGQAIGRWGNFINQEAHGGDVSRSFLENMGLPNWIIEQMRDGGVYYHPTFLYESIWNLLGFLILLLLSVACAKRLRRGELTFCYAIWYSIGRFFIEGLRTDSLQFRAPEWLQSLLSFLWSPLGAFVDEGSGMLPGHARTAQAISLLLVVGALGALVWRRFVHLAPPHHSVQGRLFTTPDPFASPPPVPNDPLAPEPPQVRSMRIRLQPLRPAEEEKPERTLGQAKQSERKASSSSATPSSSLPAGAEKAERSLPTAASDATPTKRSEEPAAEATLSGKPKVPPGEKALEAKPEEGKSSARKISEPTPQALAAEESRRTEAEESVLPAPEVDAPSAASRKAKLSSGEEVVAAVEAGEKDASKEDEAAGKAKRTRKAKLSSGEEVVAAAEAGEKDASPEDEAAGKATRKAKLSSGEEAVVAAEAGEKDASPEDEAAGKATRKAKLSSGEEAVVAAEAGEKDASTEDEAAGKATRTRKAKLSSGEEVVAAAEAGEKDASTEDEAAGKAKRTRKAKLSSGEEVVAAAEAGEKESSAESAAKTSRTRKPKAPASAESGGAASEESVGDPPEKPRVAKKKPKPIGAGAAPAARKEKKVVKPIKPARPKKKKKEE